MRWCRFCEREKPLDAFVAHRRCRFGREPLCRVCKNYQQRVRRRKRYATDRTYREATKARNRAKYQRYRPAFIARQWARDQRLRESA